MKRESITNWSRKRKFLGASNQVTTYGLENTKSILEDVFLQPVVTESGEALVIDFPEVQYALNKAELLVSENVNSKDSLNFLYATLIENPSIIIELQAHTDCRVSDYYNKKLSQRRAKSCVDSLVNNDIPM